MLMQLAEDRRRLKGIQSTVKKAQIKVELLPRYSARVEGCWLLMVPGRMTW
nr:Phage small terminase subunit [Klebsiella pneumoniae]